MDHPENISNCYTRPVPSFSTPFTKSGEIDYHAVKKMVEFYIESGFKCLMLTAGDSHYFVLDDQEIAELTKTVVKQADGRASVIGADFYYPTAKAVEFAKFLKETGADMYMALPPDWATSNTPKTFARHYAAAAEVMPVMIVTNIFIPRGDATGIEAVRKSMELSENVVAVKDDMGGIFARKACAMCRDKIGFVSGGQKQNHMNILPYGATGYLSTFARFKPEVAWNYWKNCEENNIPAAAKIIEDIDIPFFSLIASFTGGFDTGIHAALEIFGLAQRWRRPPYQNITDEEYEKLKAFFADKKLL